MCVTEVLELRLKYLNRKLSKEDYQRLYDFEKQGTAFKYPMVFRKDGGDGKLLLSFEEYQHAVKNYQSPVPFLRHLRDIKHIFPRGYLLK